MTPETVQVRSGERGRQKSWGNHIVSGICQAWQRIRQNIARLMKDGIGSLIFTVDKGAPSNTRTYLIHSQAVADELRKQFGNSPADVLMQTPPEKREALIAQLQASVAQALGMNPSIVKSDQLEGDAGCYDWDQDIIVINSAEANKQPLTLSEAKEILDTIFHETYHSLQHKAVIHPSRYSVTKQDAKIWRINFKNYVGARQNPERYYAQPVETSARLFATLVIQQLYS